MTAAAVRKLQKDIEVALKKVDDGIEEFDHVWEQATTSSNSTQKEKLGEELKKSINKLQRLRVQIREWIGQSDIKTNFKDKLEDARKRIEADMQRFKEFERDLKTKAFSACALAKGDELDLEEVEKRKKPGVAGEFYSDHERATGGIRCGHRDLRQQKVHVQ